MRRPSLSTKLLAAALPLLIAVGALLVLTVRSDLEDVSQSEVGAELGGIWDPMLTALTAVEAEREHSTGPSPDVAVTAANRRNTDQAINDLRDSIGQLGAAVAAGEHITASRSALSAARRNLDMATIAPDLQAEIDPVEAYDLASRELVSVGQLLPSEAGERELGRELLAVVKLAEAKLAADSVITGVEQWQTTPSEIAPLLTARASFNELEAVLGEFEAIAPAEWATQYRQSGFPTQLAAYRSQLAQAARAAQNGEIVPVDVAGFETLVAQGVEFQSAISQSIVDRAATQADDARRATLVRIGVILTAAVVAALVTWAISRSITRRVKAVSASANLVATEQLPALVEALRDPRGNAVLPDIAPVDARGSDELAELAEAFNSMQSTLVHVAHEQVEVLRRGVSDIFVTMARRNRSLIDRQLALLDEFEAEVDDPEVLSNYYQLDHMATRMRRNSESLLVLANAEPKRRRVKATEIDDVVRAAIGEVEDYRRIDIEALESLQVRGNVVADVSHLLAELLDNATSFSPPDSVVRVGGRRAGNSYMLRIVDDGVGIGTERMRELNALLREPPIVGLSVESTLGMSVVSLLANKHGIEVTLSAGNPGLTVDVLLPSSLFGPIEQPLPVVTPAAATAHEETIVAWNDAAAPAYEQASAAAETFEQVDNFAGYEGAPLDDDAPRVAPADWSRMSLDLSAFTSGMRSAEAAVPGPEADLGDTDDETFEPALDDDAFERALPTESFEPLAEPGQAHEHDRGPGIGHGIGADHGVDDHDAGDHGAHDHGDDGSAPAGLGDLVVLGSGTGDGTPAAELDHGLEVDPPTGTDGRSDDADVADAPASEPSVASGGDRPVPAGAAPIEPPVGLPMLDLPPPPSTSRVHGEFDVPPRPPLATEGPSRGPVTPGTTRDVPVPRIDLPGLPSLPTRSPGAGPDGGPDRLGEEPAALAAALAAFDRRDDDLPSRPRGSGGPVDEEPPSTAPSRLDPEALRERLRSFQSEFRIASDDVANNHSDLGGDRR